MYRILRALEVAGKRVEKGSLSDLEGLNAGVRDKPLAMGLISRVAAPPLKVLPGWSVRAGKLETVGIIDADQFIAADNDILADTLRTNAARIAAWKQEVRSYLKANPERH